MYPVGVAAAVRGLGYEDEEFVGEGEDLDGSWEGIDEARIHGCWGGESGGLNVWGRNGSHGEVNGGGCGGCRRKLM